MNRAAHRGRFITFEGGEGAGKSTQAWLLARALRQHGGDIVPTREPGGTPGAEAIRAMVLNPMVLNPMVLNQGEGWGPRAEALLFAAARADHVEKVIRPALMRGAWVICDRFLDSSRAYQGGGFEGEGGLVDADILSLHAIGSEGLLPDLTIWLDVSPGNVAERLRLRDGEAGTDRIGGRSAAYHARVAEAFRRFAATEPERFIRITGDHPPEAVHGRVMAAIMPLWRADRVNGAVV